MLALSGPVSLRASSETIDQITIIRLATERSFTRDEHCVLISVVSVNSYIGFRDVVGDGEDMYDWVIRTQRLFEQFVESRYRILFRIFYENGTATLYTTSLPSPSLLPLPYVSLSISPLPFPPQPIPLLPFRGFSPFNGGPGLKHRKT